MARDKGHKSNPFIEDIKRADIKNDSVNITISALNLFKSLSTRGKMVLLYLLSELDYKDYVTFNMDRAKEFTGYTSETGIYLGISELKENKIIANHYRNGYYWINPLLIYKWNRLKLIKE